jgi:pimeloyl-ACP methyl ester carboxylesterase
MPHLPVADLTLYYQEHGAPDGPPLVLLHGFNGTCDMWDAQLDAFGAHYRLLAPDLRGHGRTDNPAGLQAMNHRRFARDIVAFCRALGIARAAFCGESTGAMLLLTLGLEVPDLAAALVLAGGTYYYGEELRAWWATQTPDTLIADTRDPEKARAQHTALGPDHWRIVTSAFIACGTHAHAEDFPEPEELRGLGAPTLIIHGDRDWFFPVAVPTELYGLLPDAELCILPRTGHVPPAERPEWFNAIVLDFLARRYDVERGP